VFLCPHNPLKKAEDFICCGILEQAMPCFMLLNINQEKVTETVVTSSTFWVEEVMTISTLSVLAFFTSSGHWVAPCRQFPIGATNRGQRLRGV